MNKYEKKKSNCLIDFNMCTGKSRRDYDCIGYGPPAFAPPADTPPPFHVRPTRHPHMGPLPARRLATQKAKSNLRLNMTPVSISRRRCLVISPLEMPDLTLQPPCRGKRLTSTFIDSDASFSPSSLSASSASSLDTSLSLVAPPVQFADAAPAGDNVYVCKQESRVQLPGDLSAKYGQRVRVLHRNGAMALVKLLPNGDSGYMPVACLCPVEEFLRELQEIMVSKK